MCLFLTIYLKYELNTNTIIRLATEKTINMKHSVAEINSYSTKNKSFSQPKFPVVSGGLMGDCFTQIYDSKKIIGNIVNFLLNSFAIEIIYKFV